jgi:hypothetical protein
VADGPGGAGRGSIDARKHAEYIPIAITSRTVCATELGHAGFQKREIVFIYDL